MNYADNIFVIQTEYITLNHKGGFLYNVKITSDKRTTPILSSYLSTINYNYAYCSTRELYT